MRAKEAGDGTNSHAQQARSGMLDNEVLIREFLSSIDGSTTSSITIEKIASLYHEILNLHGQAKYFSIPTLR
jgi:hypothetical protein